MAANEGDKADAVPIVPVGLEAVYTACRNLYPDQPNPLQVTAVLKFWLGGPDPLDYISMYSNPGLLERGIPPHWHYVSFGLSDLYGDGRVHEFTGPDTPSGFGFELTFRLKREPTETAPPTWPAQLMQGLAKYVFQSDNTLCAGDHVSWHSPLDNSESRVQHMLMSEDAQLQPIATPLGMVNFVQIVGVCTEELQAAQRWNGPSILELLKSCQVAGGEWLITDMRRGETIFELNPHLQDEVERGIDMDGSNLSGVSARCSWQEPDDLEVSGDEKPLSQRISPQQSEQIKAALKKGLASERPALPPISNPQAGKPPANPPYLQSQRQSSLDSDSDPQGNLVELGNPRCLERVHIRLNHEAAALLPLSMKGRLRHGRHFTFKSVSGDCAITLVSNGVEGAFVEESHPYAARGQWLQVLFTSDFINLLEEELDELSASEQIDLPKTYQWPEKGLFITITPND
ncbi:suppressor of fused homolog [Acanthaster planci]|uniref:Suppressor of fused homolog n=1 Tax=Acanthaster planci TaxID=133434 RepID=A0A8B7Y0J7_ACAPL|nr:suppressor of fused homolog [Acanthaster planci]